MSSDLALDDILNRSLRLETPMNFRIPLDFSNILQLSNKYLEEFKDNKKARDDGKLLLSRQRINDNAVEILKTDQILQTIDESSIILSQKLSFSDKCAQALKTSISESIEKSSKKDYFLSEDYVFSNLEKQMKDKETEIYRYLCQYKPASSSRFETPQSTEEIFELKEISSFYYRYLFQSDFVHSIGEVIRSEEAQGFYSRDVQTALANTYSIIDCLSQERTPNLGSIRYLSNLTRRVIKEEVNKNRNNVKRGGAIGIIPTIESYIKLQKSEFSDSPWAILYYAMRCGVREELFQFLEKEENKSFFPDNIKSALEMHFQHLPLDESVANDLEKYHARDVTMKKIDPYKTIILSILTKKHIVPDSQRIIKSLEEWLWIRMQYFDDDKWYDQSKNVPDQLNNELKNYKPDDLSNPFLLGQLYLLINQYQKAAEWFLRCEENIDDCLHIVISMNLANLIDDQCLIKPLLLYAKDVFLSDCIAAVRYLSLLQEDELKIDAIAKLVVETENGEKIFTPLSNELPPISQVSITPDLQHKAIERSAEIAEYRGLHLKAAKIYKLIERYDHVIDLACIELRKFIGGFLDDSVRVEINNLYDEIYVNNYPVSYEKLNAMRILVRFARAFYYIHKDKKNPEYRNAVDEIEMAEFLPTSKEKARSFRETLMANEHLRKALPELIIMTIHCYAELYTRNSKSNIKKPGMWRKDREKAEAILELTSDIDIPNYAQKQLLDFSLKFQ